MPSRARTPAVSVAAMPVTAVRTAAIAAGKATPRAADSMSVLDGTHPVNVHSPPISPSETSSVRAPAAAPARAAPSPAAPPPMTTRSYSAATGQPPGRIPPGVEVVPDPDRPARRARVSVWASTWTPFQNAT
jgi:hypothetical protein